MAGNLLTNPGFEAGVFSPWTTSAAGSSTITIDSTNQRSGSYCAKMYVDGSTNYVQIAQADLFEVGQEYTVSYWAKADGAASLNFEGFVNQTAAQNIATSGWTKYSFTRIAEDTHLSIKRNSGADVNIWIDDIRVEATPVKIAVLRGSLSLDIASPDTDFTETDFGTPKAAIVLLSNANTTDNPAVSATYSIGFWDGTNQYITWGASANGVVSSSTCDRGELSGLIARANVGGGTSYADYTIANTTDGVTITMTVDTTSYARYATVILIGGAAVQTDVQTHALGAVNGYLSNELSVGFKPDLILIGCAAIQTASATQHIGSFGACSRTELANQRGILWYDKDQTTSTDAYSWSSTSQVGGQYYSQNMDWSGDITEFNGGGYQTQTTGTTGGDYFTVLSLKIPGVNVYVGDLATAASTGTQSFTGVGFKPQALIIASCLAQSSNSGFPGLGVSLGAGTATQESSIAIHSRDGVGTSDAGSQSKEAVVNVLDGSGSEKTLATIDSFDDDGFTLDFTVAVSATRGFFIAFGDTDYRLNKKIPKTASGNWLVIN